MRVLVTGAAGFIGAAVCNKLLSEGHDVVGVDCFTPYYDPTLKRDRLVPLQQHKFFAFVEADITAEGALLAIVKKSAASRLIHLAAQPGVRNSLVDPQLSVDYNVTGFLKVLEACREQKIEHLVFASSSSVYGANRKLPFSEKDSVDHPLSLYAATKRANELMAHSYSHLFQIPTTGLRFFTVYGPWGRPDMVPYKFCLALMRNQSIEVYNGGNHKRDFIFIDDIAAVVTKIFQVPPKPNLQDKRLAPSPEASSAPFRIYNVGNRRPESLEKVIGLIENSMGKIFQRTNRPLQRGDIGETFADIEALKRDFGFEPKTNVETGIEKFVDWFKGYQRV